MRLCTGLVCHELTGKTLLCLLKPKVVFYGDVCPRKTGQCCGGVGHVSQQEGWLGLGFWLPHAQSEAAGAAARDGVGNRLLITMGDHNL